MVDLRSPSLGRESPGTAKRPPSDEGAAIVEFIALSLLLLVPLTYLVVTLSRIQAGAFAAEGAAHEAARTTVVTGSLRANTAPRGGGHGRGSPSADAAVALVADDFGFDSDAASLVDHL